MLTQDIFKEHKADYTVMRKIPTYDRYGSETNTFEEGGTINVMWTPITDEASIQTFGEQVNDMKQAVVYDSTEIDEHDQVLIAEKKYEFVSIKEYPSYRLVQVKRV